MTNSYDRGVNLPYGIRFKDLIINTAVITVAIFERKRIAISTGSTFSSSSYIITFLIAAFLLLVYLGIHLLDESRSPKNRSLDHLYTRIHGVWYDFASFDHPGGPIALNLAKDRDATVLFESHHLLSKIDMSKILSKYQIDAKTAQGLSTIDPNDNGGHYEWENFHNDIFTQEIKATLVAHFSAIAKKQNCSLFQAAKASKKRWSLLGVLALAVIITMPYYVAGHFWALPIMPIIAWVLVANYWHDALHFSLSSDWRINASLPYLFPILSSPWIWYHQHVIGHHAYTNIGKKDPDLAHAPQLKREHDSIAWKKSHEHQATLFRFIFLWSIATNMGLSILNDIKTNLKLSYNNVVGFQKLSHSRLLFHVVGRIVYFFIMFLWPLLVFSIQKSMSWIVISNILFSCCFMVNSQVNHLNEDCSNASDVNFLKHQVMTAQNFGCESLFCTIFSGGLNYQIEHHLFPFVNHCHLPALGAYYYYGWPNRF